MCTYIYYLALVSCLVCDCLVQIGLFVILRQGLPARTQLFSHFNHTQPRILLQHDCKHNK